MKAVRTLRQKIAIIAAACFVLGVWSMVLGLYAGNLAVLLIGGGGAMISGGIGMFVINRCAFFSLSALMLPWFVAVAAEHVGKSVIRAWWFWTLTAISLIIGIALLLRVVSAERRDEARRFE